MTNTRAAKPQQPAETKADSADGDNTTASDRHEQPGLFVVSYTHGGTDHVELLGESQAEARVAALTYGSKQHVKQVEEDGGDPIEGGGTHQINRDDIHVYRLTTSEVTDF